MQAFKLLVEIGTQAVELILIGKFQRGDSFVILGRPDLVIALWQMVPIAALRGDRLHAVIAHVPIGTLFVFHILLVIVGFGILAIAVLWFAARFGLTGFAFALVFAFAILLLIVVGILAAFIGVRRVDIAFGQIEMLKHRLG